MTDCQEDLKIIAMNLIERYLFKNIFWATLFATLILVAVIMLTQSLRFLELVINSGASSLSFWILTGLALPRFFEVILPVSLMGAILFVYNKLTMDSEIIVMRAVGLSPFKVARPAIILSIMICLFLFVMTVWAGPTSLSQMQKMRQIIKSQYSTLLFKEGVFNNIGKGLTVYIREKGSKGELKGLLIHDSRKKDVPPATVIAKHGSIVSTEEGQKVVVYEGSRQDFNHKTGALNRLNFERYIINLPDEASPIRQRWKEPDERTFIELLNPDPTNKRDAENKREFTVEIHRRIISPFLAPAFAIVALCTLLIGPLDRRGMAWRIATAIVLVVIIQGLYLGAFSLARHSNIGLILMYFLVFLPSASGLFLMSRTGENIRGTLFSKHSFARKRRRRA